MRHFSVVNFLQPDTLLNPAADAGGRTGTYRNVTGAHRVFITYHITQGNAATVALTPQQAKDTSGTSAKAILTAKIYVNEDTSLGSGNFVQQTDAASYTTTASTKNKIVVFELDLPDALDLTNSFKTITAQTGASNAANITSAVVEMYGSYLGASGLGID